VSQKENPLNRRARLLEQEWDRRAASIEAQLFSPSPPFSQKMNEMDAFRKYLDDKAQGFFLNARESNGGDMRDSDVDEYSKWGLRMEAKYLPHMLLRDMTGNQPEYFGIVDQVRRAKLRFDDPEDQPEEWVDTSDADDSFE
jgi:hypothetical protein